MPKFTAKFYTEADWAYITITGKSPAHALRRARRIYREGSLTLDFQHYESTAGVEHIEIANGAGRIVAQWKAAELHRRLAADQLFDALKQAIHALNTTPSFYVPVLKTDSYTIAASCAAAIDAARPPRGRSR